MNIYLDNNDNGIFGSPANNNNRMEVVSPNIYTENNKPYFANNTGNSGAAASTGFIGNIDSASSESNESRLRSLQQPEQQPEQQSTTQSQDSPPSPATPFDLNRLKEAREWLFLILESHAGVASFLLFLAFATVVTFSAGSTASFPLFALAIRMLLHFVVVIVAFRHADILVSVIGIVIIFVGLPFVADSTPAAGICAYILLVLPLFAEQSLKNEAVRAAIRDSGAAVGLYRKRAVQITQLSAPIAVAIFPLFSLQGGLLFHLSYVVVALVFIASHVVRALEMKKLNDAATTISSSVGGGGGAGEVQVLDGGIIVSPAIGSSSSSSAVPAANNDAVSRFVQDLQQRRATFETNLSQNNPTVYQYYLYLPKASTTAICTYFLFVLLVVNVSSYTPSESGNNVVHHVVKNDTIVPSLSSSSPSSPPPASTSTPTFAATTVAPISSGALQYDRHFYLSIGLVSAFLMASIELITDAFLPSSNSIKDTTSKNNTNNTNNGTTSAVSTTSPRSEQQHQRQLANDGNDGGGRGQANDPSTAGEAPSFFKTLMCDLRYRRFALLLISFVLAFLPDSIKVYPAALALASYVPWLVWRDSCGNFISTFILLPSSSSSAVVAPGTDNSNNVNNSSNSANTRIRNRDRAVSNVRNHAGAGADDDNDDYEGQGNTEASRNVATSDGSDLASQQQREAAPSPIEAFFNERVVADFLVPTIVTALILLLATGAEDKKPGHFLSFVAIVAHGTMAYFLYVSLNQSLPTISAQQRAN